MVPVITNEMKHLIQKYQRLKKMQILTKIYQFFVVYLVVRLTFLESCAALLS